MSLIKTSRVMLLGLLVCLSAGATPPARHFLEQRVYQHALFPTLEDCHKAQQTFPVNCFQVARFEQDGRATMMVTDIMNPGHYAIEGNQLIFLPDSAVEVGKMVFVLSPDEKTLTLQSDGSVWNLSDKS